MDRREPRASPLRACSALPPSLPAARGRIPFLPARGNAQPWASIVRSRDLKLFGKYIEPFSARTPYFFRRDKSRREGRREEERAAGTTRKFYYLPLSRRSRASERASVRSLRCCWDDLSSIEGRDVTKVRVNGAPILLHSRHEVSRSLAERWYFVRRAKQSEGSREDSERFTRGFPTNLRLEDR